MTHQQLRKKFISFFNQKNHLTFEGASLVPVNDSSLLWINSGVATLKKYFSGLEIPPSKRLTSSQRSIRTNDIENVGITSRHHTLFEMLGNFSIGDYFKENAIKWAWEFLTLSEWLNLPKDKLYVTVFKEDIEAIKIWTNQIKLPKDHLIFGTKKTNFWDMGKGPCGPNTEIYYDRGISYDPKKEGLKLLIEDKENDRYIEIWNIVFSEFNNDGTNKYISLPQKNIDTGMGLERILAILQNKPTNYETDLFMPIILGIQRYAKIPYNTAKGKQLAAYRIIADHIRAIVFAIADGVIPTNKGRGYIIRRLIRRSISTFSNYLAKNETQLLVDLVQIVIKQMEKPYPFLKEQETLINTIIADEEKKFLISLKRATQEFEKNIPIWDMNKAFNLFDTHGVPIETIKDWANNHNLNFDKKVFNALYEKHVQLSRKHQNFGLALDEQSSFLEKINQFQSVYVGEESYQADATLLCLIKNNEIISSANLNDEVIAIFDKTPFYAESGGQIHDQGLLLCDENQATIFNVQKGPNNIHLHYLKVTQGKFRTNDQVTLKYDQKTRKQISINHSATHLLHEAICDVLNEKVIQSGSYLDSQRFRFDFSTKQKINNKIVIEILNKCNQIINKNLKLNITNIDLDEAKKRNIHMNFDDKYGQKVRVVSFADYSIQLCGGSHVKNSQEIEKVDITNWKLIGSNTYRFEAITTNSMINEHYQQKNQISRKEIDELAIKINELLKQKHINKKHVLFEQLTNYPKSTDFNSLQIQKQAIENLKKSLKEVETHIEFIEQHRVTAAIGNFIINNSLSELVSSKFVSKTLIIVNLNMINIKYLRPTLMQLRPNFPNKIIILYINKLCIFLSDDYSHKANFYLKQILESLNGSGGGNKDFAQGKINNNISIEKMVKLIKPIINED